jgi:hypothetical protein
MDMDRIKVSEVQARANPKKSLDSRYHLQKLDPASKLSMQIWIVTRSQLTQAVNDTSKDCHLSHTLAATHIPQATITSYPIN